MRCTVCTPGQHFEFANIEIDALAHRRQHALSRTRSAMHRKAHLHQVIGYALNLVFARTSPTSQQS